MAGGFLPQEIIHEIGVAREGGKKLRGPVHAGIVQRRRGTGIAAIEGTQLTIKDAQLPDELLDRGARNGMDKRAQGIEQVAFACIGYINRDARS
jgi:hypothetical protein